MAHILIVDDDDDIRILVSEALRYGGRHRVSDAADVKQGLAKLRRRTYDLVILDIRMPGATGYDFLEALRAMPQRAGLPVIVLTAYHEPAGVMREAELGAADHLTKPFRIDELEEAVARALGSPEELEERRQVLLNEAEMYGSLIDLVATAREDETVGKRR